MGDHRNKNVPECMTYLSMITRESMIILFLIITLNDQERIVVDIANVYLNVLSKEKGYAAIEQ